MSKDVTDLRLVLRFQLVRLLLEKPYRAKVVKTSSGEIEVKYSGGYCRYFEMANTFSGRAKMRVRFGVG